MLTNLPVPFDFCVAVGAFNQEKVLVGAFSVIVQPVVEPMDRFAALVLDLQLWILNSLQFIVVED